MLRRSFAVLSLVILSLCLTAAAKAADQTMKPYILGYQGTGTIEDKLPGLRAGLERKGFQVAGEYEPYKGARILAVTSDVLKAAAAKSDFGAYGAIIRVSITDTGKELQVAATNPRYYAAAYRMQDSLNEVAAALEEALGKTAEFGSRDGMTASALRKYHYMVMMPYFDDAVKLASYPSQDAALTAVEAALAVRKGGSSKVYRIDIPGRQASVIGVAIAEGEGSDAAIMKVIDIGALKHTPHLPCEMVVSNGTVYMLHGKFRIALDFPDLTMSTFMKISGAPSAIEKKLRVVAGDR